MLVQEVSILFPTGSYKDLDISRMAKDGELVQWDVGAPARMRPVIPLTAGGCMRTGGGACRDDGGGATEG